MFPVSNILLYANEHGLKQTYVLGAGSSGEARYKKKHIDSLYDNSKPVLLCYCYAT